MGYKSATQEKNVAWFLPRPKRDRYKGGMPLYAEEWLLDLAFDIWDPHHTQIDREKCVLNLFCGMNTHGFRVDINPDVKPDIVCDAHDLSPLGDRMFNIILADPPYSAQEAKELYGIDIRLKYKKWTAECEKRLLPHGILIVYHKYIMPNPDPQKFEVVKRVFIGNRVYHLPRVAIYFQKK